MLRYSRSKGDNVKLYRGAGAVFVVLQVIEQAAFCFVAERVLTTPVEECVAEHGESDGLMHDRLSVVG